MFLFRIKIKYLFVGAEVLRLRCKKIFAPLFSQPATVALLRRSAKRSSKVGKQATRGYRIDFNSSTATR